VALFNLSFMLSDCPLCRLPCSRHVGKGNIDVFLIKKEIVIQLILFKFLRVIKSVKFQFLILAGFNYFFNALRNISFGKILK
jgi:hypothetical protein